MIVQRKRDRTSVPWLTNELDKYLDLSVGYSVTLDLEPTYSVECTVSFQTPSVTSIDLNLLEVRAGRSKLLSGCDQTFDSYVLNSNDSDLCGSFGVSTVYEYLPSESIEDYNLQFSSGVNAVLTLDTHTYDGSDLDEAVVETKNRKTFRYYIFSKRTDLSTEYTRVKTEVKDGEYMYIFDVPNSAWINKQDWLSDVEIYTEDTISNKT